MRFVFVGGLATVIDFLVMGITLYACDPSLYPHFYNAFFRGGEPALYAKMLGTGLGFLFGLISNYVLSVFFVFNEKGNSRSAKGFIIFAIFSAIGLGIHLLGMWFFSGVLSINEWIVKILMTAVVLVYNYLTRRIFIFKKDDNGKSTENRDDSSEHTENTTEKNSEVNDE